VNESAHHVVTTDELGRRGSGDRPWGWGLQGRYLGEDVFGTQGDVPRRAVAKRAPVDLFRKYPLRCGARGMKFPDIRTTEIPRAVGNNGHLRTIVDHQKS
jgi:hypothetical protein